MTLINARNYNDVIMSVVKDRISREYKKKKIILNLRERYTIL